MTRSPMTRSPITRSPVDYRVVRAAFPVVLAIGLSGCLNSSREVVAPLRPAPSQPVRSAELSPPPGEVPEAPVAGEPLPGEASEGQTPEGQGPSQTASLPDAPAGLEVGRTDLLGGWQISSGGDTCQLFMSLTQWTGGNRASTRGCQSPQLSRISAWELSGSTVTLKTGETANQMATLVATEEQRFSGATTAGTPITVSR